MSRYSSLLAQQYSCQHVVVTNSGTSAIEVAMRACGAMEGVTVLAPSMMPVMTYLPMKSIGCRVVAYSFGDKVLAPCIAQLSEIDPATAPPGTILITLPWWGYRYDWAATRRLVDSRGWFWVEDAAHAQGSSPNMADGDCPDLLCASTHDRKLISTGEGGYVCTNSADLGRKAASWASYGGYPETTDDLDLGFEAGANLRLSGMAAALGIASVRNLPSVLDRRANAGAVLEEAARKLHHLHLMQRGPYPDFNYYGLVFLTEQEGDGLRVSNWLDRQGLQNDVHEYRMRRIADYPIASSVEILEDRSHSIWSRVVCVSPHHGLTPEELTFVGETLLAADDLLGGQA
ncbi:MAG: DegT/DnrJ/EryC1/StrS family aminotransferase [Acidipropionibacterium sp.]|nr:DegT/DnrJ/EryC1/StrS family aminotransferase [Acidipropionibacterium sp.]